MPPVWFEPAIPASEGPQNHALDRAATGTVINSLYGAQFTRTDPLIILKKPSAGRDKVVADIEA